MSNINPLSGNSPVYRTTPSKPAASSAAVEGKPAARGDRVELSNMSELMGKLKTNDVRMDKVAEIKAQIAAGTYETDEKLQAAADKMLDDVL
ncbi:MAG TPA: flagellar biosynthesis anti-sigma factor FlgM [Tepidisphaeraceae bacterium]|jgi:negative regulator of flagellin synthesis FlgM